MTKPIELEITTPVLNYLQREAGEGFAKALGQVVASGDGLVRLEAEIGELRRAVAKASGGKQSGGPRELRLKLAEAEQAADRISESDLRVQYERRARDIRKELEG